MNSNRTVSEKEFHNWIVEKSLCAVSDEMYPEIHHIAGAKAKLKGVKNFGEKYCIGLSFYWHRDGSNKCARHVNKSAFVKKIGDSEKELWTRVVDEYFDQYGRYPAKMTEEEYQIILERA